MAIVQSADKGMSPFEPRRSPGPGPSAMRSEFWCGQSPSVLHDNAPPRCQRPPVPSILYWPLSATVMLSPSFAIIQKDRFL